MNWREIGRNRRGFVHHPETPPEDKVFYIRYKERARQLLEIGERFIESEGVLSHRSIVRGKEELGIKSKHLHRGVYCPSPVLDILITNSKRGKILIRPSARSNITNRYVYDKADRLIFTDNYFDGKMASAEYLLYEDNTVYGVTVGMSGRLVSISEERYSKGRLESYLCAYYSGEKYNYYCRQLDCEKYGYDEQGLLDWDYYQIHYEWETVAPSGFIKHDRYRFVREDGWLKSFTRIDIDGTPVDGSCVNEIKLKRKA